jgi:hypothetical protein
LTIKFYPDGEGNMTWAYATQGTPVLFSYGTMFANWRFRKIAILESRPGGGTEWFSADHGLVTGTMTVPTTNSGWQANNGLTIAGPASNRATALRISNTLIKSYLEGYKLR